MGHDLHFLSRLSRVTAAQVDLALDLYRDTERVRFIVDGARTPPDAARVALALGFEADTPHVVVTRDGHFVTCLAAGMSVGTLPRVTRAQIDSATARLTRFRERLAAAKTLGDDPFELELYVRHYEAGHTLSREEICASLALAPMMVSDNMRAVGMALKRWGLARVRARGAWRNPEWADAPRQFWNEVWALAHFTVVGYSEPQLIHDFVPAEGWPMVVQAGLTSVLGTNLVAAGLRGLWGVSHCGRLAVGPLKEMLGNGGEARRHDAAFALACIALGHTRFEAEVRKALARNDVLAPLLLPLLDAPDVAHAEFLATGRRLAVRRTARLPPDSRLRYAREEDVPDDMAATFAANSLEDTMSSEGFVGLMSALPWLSRARPEDLYLPGELLQALDEKWTPAHSQLLVDRMPHEPPPPAVRPDQPGRNDPCSCGSGRKFKKCCGAGRQSR